MSVYNLRSLAFIICKNVITFFHLFDPTIFDINLLKTTYIYLKSLQKLYFFLKNSLYAAKIPYIQCLRNKNFAKIKYFYCFYDIDLL